MTPDVYGQAPVVEELVRCWRCNRLLAELLTKPWAIVCPRCKARNQGS
jgi:phage FluMu protein Com